mmetsp:Transcript_19723/g.37562  ORF Transcript_19723/g.37562 Transcript_19723/m.37562 type:complete len:414 (-) Transcript_19723:267-1508(-)
MLPAVEAGAHPHLAAPGQVRVLVVVKESALLPRHRHRRLRVQHVHELLAHHRQAGLAHGCTLLGLLLLPLLLRQLALEAVCANLLEARHRRLLPLHLRDGLVVPDDDVVVPSGVVVPHRLLLVGHHKVQDVTQLGHVHLHLKPLALEALARAPPHGALLRLPSPPVEGLVHHQLLLIVQTARLRVVQQHAALARHQGLERAHDARAVFPVPGGVRRLHAALHALPLVVHVAPRRVHVRLCLQAQLLQVLLSLHELHQLLPRRRKRRLQRVVLAVLLLVKALASVREDEAHVVSVLRHLELQAPPVARHAVHGAHLAAELAHLPVVPRTNHVGFPAVAGVELAVRALEVHHRGGARDNLQRRAEELAPALFLETRDGGRRFPGRLRRRASLRRLLLRATRLRRHFRHSVLGILQ